MCIFLGIYCSRWCLKRCLALRNQPVTLISITVVSRESHGVSNQATRPFVQHHAEADSKGKANTQAPHYSPFVMEITYAEATPNTRCHLIKGISHKISKEATCMHMRIVYQIIQKLSISINCFPNIELYFENEVHWVVFKFHGWCYIYLSDMYFWIVVVIQISIFCEYTCWWWYHCFHFLCFHQLVSGDAYLYMRQLTGSSIMGRQWFRQLLATC